MTNRYQGVDPILTKVSIGYTNDEYIASQLLPDVTVDKQSGKHFIYDRGRFRNTVAKRGTGAPSNEVTLNVTTGLPYFAEDHALKEFVPDEDVDNAVAPADPYQDATENVTDRLLIGREIEAASLLTSTAVLTQNTTLSGTAQWSDYSNSDPIATLRTGMQAVHSAIFHNPNTLILGKQVYDKIIDHPAFTERVKYSQLGVMTPDLLSRILGVDRVIVGAAGKNSSAEGQTDSMATSGARMRSSRTSRLACSPR